MSKKDKKKELGKAAKKAKKEKLEKLAGKSAELAEELKAEREATLAVDEASAGDAVAVVEQKQDKKQDKKQEKKKQKKAQAPVPAYVAVEGDKLRTISIKMPTGLIEATDKAAAAYGEGGVSRSEFIRVAIEKLINE